MQALRSLSIFRSAVQAISSTGALSASSIWGTTFQRWATKKAGGSSNNGRKATHKRLGVKKFGGEYVIPGNIIIRQRGTKYRIGDNVGLGKDHTIWALVEGHVKFRYSNLDKHQYVSVVPPLKFGAVCEHKAIEARSFKELDRATGYLGLAKFAYSKAGEEGMKKEQAMQTFKLKLRDEFIAAKKKERQLLEAKKQALAIKQ